MGWVTETPGSRCAGTCITSRGKPRVWWELTARSGSERVFLHQEKNWGGAFPSSWVWFQVNEFDDRPDVALLQRGPIFSFPWAPEGYMAGLRWKDQFFNGEPRTAISSRWWNSGSSQSRRRLSGVWLRRAGPTGWRFGSAFR